MVVNKQTARYVPYPLSAPLTNSESIDKQYKYIYVQQTLLLANKLNKSFDNFPSNDQRSYKCFQNSQYEQTFSKSNLYSITSNNKFLSNSLILSMLLLRFNEFIIYFCPMLANKTEQTFDNFSSNDQRSYIQSSFYN